jgi:hypothetical protein
MAVLLAAAGVITKVPDSPEKITWRAGDAVLVCTGDLLDKGNRALDVLAALRSLQRDATRAGGRVVITMGNHEAEFLAQPENKKGAEFRQELQERGLDQDAVARGADPEGIGAFLRALPFAARVNDWFFAHAGNTKGLTLEELRASLETGVDRDGFAAPILMDEDSLLEARLKKHPWWEKPNDANGAGEERLRRYVRSVGASHLVIGHQPEGVEFAGGDHREKGKMFSGFDGLVFLIDVGMSRAIDDSKGALLRIHGRNPLRATEVDHKGGTLRLWTEH